MTRATEACRKLDTIMDVLQRGKDMCKQLSSVFNILVMIILELYTFASWKEFCCKIYCAVSG